MTELFAKDLGPDHGDHLVGLVPLGATDLVIDESHAGAQRGESQASLPDSGLDRPHHALQPDALGAARCRELVARQVGVGQEPPHPLQIVRQGLQFGPMGFAVRGRRLTRERDAKRLSQVGPGPAASRTASVGRCGSQSPAGQKLALGKPSIDPDPPVRQGLVAAILGIQGLQLAEDSPRRGAHAARMESITDQRSRTGGPGSGGRQPDPEIPVREVTEIEVEAPNRADQLGPHEHIRRPRGNRIVTLQQLGELVRRRRLRQRDRPVVVAHQEDTGVGERRIGGLGDAQLGVELVGSPHVVVVQERDPRPRRLRDTGVSRRRHSPGAIVSDNSDTRIIQVRNG